MKRQTRPFVVEIKQSRRGATKPLWSGRELLMLKEARPEEPVASRDAPAATPVPAPVAAPARILVATVAPAPIEPPAATVVEAKPTSPRVTRARAPRAAATIETPKAPRKTAKTMPEIAVTPIVAAAPIAADPITPPLRSRDRDEETLPRGQRWKRRLPKAIR